MNFNKLKDQKGVTGIDVVIAIVIISITTLAITVLYGNIIVGSKKVTRTAAATRIATQMMENIETLYYAEVEHQIDLLTKANSSGNNVSVGNYNGTMGLSSSDSSKLVLRDYLVKSSYPSKVFGTKLQPGYNVEVVTSEYRSPSDVINNSLSDKMANVGMVIQIKIIVKYDVAGKPQEIALTTVKERELMELNNAPVLEDIIDMTIGGKKVQSTKSIQPIKWNSEAGYYVSTTSADPEWYSYSNGEWAKVVLSNVTSNKDIFVGGTNQINIDAVDAILLWVPRYGIASSAENVGKAFFANGTSNDAIQLFSVKIPSGKYFSFRGPALYDSSSSSIKKEKLAILDAFRNGNKELKGKWVIVKGSGASGFNDLVNGLSEYSKPVPHAAKSDGTSNVPCY